MKASKDLSILQLALVMLAVMGLSTQSLAGDSGGVRLPGLSTAVPGNTVLCYDSSTEQLGPCAPAAAGTPPCIDPNNRFMDCGDGTVYDKQTGLMWEKKEDCGGVENLVNPHCRANLYTWSPASPWTETGTLFSDFLEKLNDLKFPNDGTATPCFAGYCDWRIPTIGELRSILLAPYGPGGANCSSPCLDAIFGPTQASGYWSSSSSAIGPGVAWCVYFFDGIVNDDSKNNDNHARAVRSGR